MHTPVSVVITVLDDRDGLAELLPALSRQQRPPDEVVIVDAGSRDGSEELIEYWRRRGLPARVVSAPGAGISEGRNRGIEAAAHEWIAVTDAGCRPEAGWLEALARGLEENDFVAGTYRVDTDTPFEHAVAVSLYPEVTAVDAPPARWQRAWHALFGRTFETSRATGRSMAFRRPAWRAAGGFPEAVDTGEDVAFSAAMVAGGRSVLAADAVVRWRGRPTWWSNARMYWRYAEGEAVLGAGPRAIVRGAALIAGAVLAVAGRRPGRALVVLGVGVYAAVPAARARRTGLAMRHWWRIPAVIALKDAAMAGGTFVGIAQRVLGFRRAGGPARKQ